MSFEFKWPSFSPSFYEHAKHLLCTALNKGDKPEIITDPIQVNHLDMGTIPPELEILEIGDLGYDRFRGIFRMTYAGDASICLQTKVQVNPLRQNTANTTPDILTSPSILFASTPLVVPMSLKLSCLKLRAIVVLVISRLEGVTLVFKNDPLEAVQVSSTFDSLSTIQSFLQAEIERQLRELFRTELPGLIHQLSRKYLQSTSQQDPIPTTTPMNNTSPDTTSQPTTPNLNVADTKLLSPLDSVPGQVESYDPTYGLRPSHPPLIGNFGQYRSLVERKKRSQGLGAVLSSFEEDETNPNCDDGDVTLQSSQSLTHVSDEYSIANPREESVGRNSICRGKLARLSSLTPGSGSPTIAKPRIFHSNSAGMVGAYHPTSPISSLFGQDDRRSVMRIPSSKDQVRVVGCKTRVRGEDEGECELLRSRRMERFSVDSKTTSRINEQLAQHISPSPSRQLFHSPSKSSPSVSPRLPLAEQGMTTVNLSRAGSFRTEFGYRSHSNQRSVLRLLPSSSTPNSPIFIAQSGSSSSATDVDPGEEEEGSSSQCDLLASLVRGNWTLSPFSRSIDHYVSRSTPFRLDDKQMKTQMVTRRDKMISGLNRCREANPYQECEADQDSRGMYWDQQVLDEGFKQKRITRIQHS